MKSSLFLVLLVVMATEGADDCPAGTEIFYCFVAPCQYAQCPLHPDATCVDNYCGGCHDDWYNADGDLVVCTEGPTPCPGGENLYVCLTSPCDDATCDGYPDAECRDNYCGGCNVEWVDADGNQIECNKGWRTEGSLVVMATFILVAILNVSYR